MLTTLAIQMRLNALTDDLTQADMYALLLWAVQTGAMTFRDIKAWRKKNGKPVDNTD